MSPSVPHVLWALGGVAGAAWAQKNSFLRVLGVIMFFRKAPPQTEGRRYADPGIKTSPVGIDVAL